MVCKSCGKEVTEGVKFCPACGSKIDEKQENTCISCGTEIKKGMKFCPVCGARYSDNKDKKNNIFKNIFICIEKIWLYIWFRIYNIVNMGLVTLIDVVIRHKTEWVDAVEMARLLEECFIPAASDDMLYYMQRAIQPKFRLRFACYDKFASDDGKYVLYIDQACQMPSTRLVKQGEKFKYEANFSEHFKCKELIYDAVQKELKRRGLDLEESIQEESSNSSKCSPKASNNKKKSKKPLMCALVVLVLLAIRLFSSDVGDAGNVEESVSINEEMDTETLPLEEDTDFVNDDTRIDIPESSSIEEVKWNNYLGKWYAISNSSEDIFTDGGAMLQIFSVVDGKVVFSLTQTDRMSERIADISRVEGTIQGDMATYEFKDDGWGNAGMVELIFYDETIAVRTAVTEPSPSGDWNINVEDTFVKHIIQENTEPNEFDNVENSKVAYFKSRIKKVENLEDLLWKDSVAKEDVVAVESKIHQAWEELLAEMYEYLQDNLPDEEFERLREEEMVWIETKGTAPLENNPDVQLEYYNNLIEKTRLRCMDLLHYIEINGFDATGYFTR